MFKDIPREDSAISSKGSYLDLDFNGTPKFGGHARFANGGYLRLVNLGPIAFFNKYRLTSSSLKEIEENDSVHVICLMYKFITRNTDSDDLSFDFQRNNEAQEIKWLVIKQLKEIIMLKKFLKDVFGLTEHQDKCTHGVTYKLTLQRNSDNHLLSHPAVANDAANLVLAGRVIKDDISWYAHFILQIYQFKNYCLDVLNLELQRTCHIWKDQLIWKM